MLSFEVNKDVYITLLTLVRLVIEVWMARRLTDLRDGWYDESSENLSRQ